MKLSKFRYKLPPELIAQHPSANRDECRLMVVDRKTGTIEHKVFKDVIDYFDEKDVFVFNDTKVFRPVYMGIRKKPVLKSKSFVEGIESGSADLGRFGGSGTKDQNR